MAAIPLLHQIGNNPVNGNETFLKSLLINLKKKQRHEHTTQLSKINRPFRHGSGS